MPPAAMRFVASRLLDSSLGYPGEGPALFFFKVRVLASFSGPVATPWRRRRLDKLASRQDWNEELGLTYLEDPGHYPDERPPAEAEGALQAVARERRRKLAGLPGEEREEPRFHK